MNQSELINRILNKICPNCGGREYEKGKDGALYCTYCSTKLPGNENETNPALDEIINKRIVDKDFEGALERCKIQIDKDPSNLAYYWQAVLAYYGVIYVRDDDGHAKPTFFNIEYDSSRKDTIKKSKYFKELEKHAQSEADLVDYRKNVDELDDVLNKLSELVEKEKTFDVFISFKSTYEEKTADGRVLKLETKDKKKAKEVYDRLTKKGYRVFYSPEVIEKNAGAQGKVYEPVILRALQTSQVMLLFGSKEEYLNATWVENEWRRYKYYVTTGQKKPDSIIVLYEQQKPEFPSALTRAAIGTVQIKNIDYFDGDYLDQVETAIKPFVLNREIGATKIVRGVVQKGKRTIETQTLEGYKNDGNVDLGIKRTLKLNVEPDLANPSRRKKAIKTIKDLKEQNPNSGMALAYDLLVELGGSSIKELPKLMPKATDWNATVACVKEIIAKADDEDFYKDFLGSMYETVLNMAKTKKSVSLFSVIKNCRYEESGVDYRVENLYRLKTQAKAVLNGELFNDIIDCLALPDEQYKEELTDFARKALAEKKYVDAQTLAERILKLDNSLIDLIDIRNRAKWKASEWSEVFANSTAYANETIYKDFEELVSFTSSNTQIDTYLDSVYEAVIGGLNAQIQPTYNDFVDKFLGLYRKNNRRRAVIERITDLAISRRCFDTCIHYCEFLLNKEKEDSPEDAKVFWKMTLCHFKCKDKKGLMSLREEIDTCSYFVKAQICADEAYATELAAIRNEQLDAVQNNRAYDEKQRKQKKSRKVGRIVNSVILAAVLCGVVLGVLAYLGIGPLFASFYGFSLGLFNGAIYFIIAAVLLFILIISCIATYSRITKRKRYSGGSITKSVFVVLLLAIVIALPYIATIPALANILPLKTYVTEDGAVLALEKNYDLDSYNSTASADSEDNNANEADYVYTVTKIMLPNGVTGVNVPDEIDSVKVTALGSNLFEFCKDRVERIKFGENISEVGYNAFRDCKSLRMVSFGSKTENVDSEAFAGCTDVTIHTEKDYTPSSWWGFISEEVKIALSSKYAGEEIIEGDYSYYINSSGYAVIFKYNGTEENVTVPAEIDGHTVKGIESDAFGNSLKSIVIPDSITFVSSRAFLACKNLTSATAGLDALKALPNSITSLKVTGSGIFDAKFQDLSRLTSIELAGQFTGLGDYAFAGCKNLTSITIPDSVTSIGNNAFAGCSSLTSIIIPDNVTKVGEKAFYGCSNLTSASIGNGVKNIDASTFYGCVKLTSVVIPESVTSIGDYAFCNCSDLNSIVIPQNVTRIGFGAFSGCSSLNSITIPFVGAKSGVTSSDKDQYPFGYIFGTSSFTGGMATKQYYYGSSTTITTYDTYYIPTSLNSVTVTGGNILYCAFSNCSGLTSIEISNTVTSIGASAFYGCSGLKNMVIPDSVTSIGEGALSGCSSLVSLTIPFIGAKAGVTASSIYQYPFGYIFGTTSYEGGTATEQYYYGSSTSEVTSNTFYIPDSLKNVTVTGGNILYGAFYNCNNLKSITIPDSATSIGGEAFNCCGSLTSITIPKTVKSIDKAAFTSCSGLTSVNYTGDAAGWCGIEFSDNLSNPINYAKSLRIDNNIVTQLVIPDSVKAIGNYAFYNCDSLMSVTIGSGVETIGSYSFSNCEKIIEVKNLSELPIEKGATSYGSVARYANRVYKEGESYLSTDENGYVIYNDGADKVLYGYSGDKTELTIPDGITKISKVAFLNCSDLKSVIIPASVTEIGAGAFSGCSSLNSITIPFVGAKAEVTSSDSYQYPFGYIFGTTSYEGGTATKQYYYGSGTSSTTYDTYYIPTSLKSVTVTGEKISDYAFSNFSGLTSITLSDNIASIGSHAFYNCSGLTSITLSDNIASIGAYAFYNCTGLTSITLPGNIESIGSQAFYNCAGLSSIVIPDSVTTIGTYAFYNCSYLTTVTIGSGVKSIGRYAFQQCSKLTQATFKVKTGWKRYTSSTATSGTSISSSNLSNTSTAATYLRSTYYNYYWKRS